MESVEFSIVCCSCLPDRELMSARRSLSMMNMTKLMIITLALICNFWNRVVIGKYCAPLHWKPNQPNVKNRRMYNQSLNSVVLSYKMFLFEEETSCKHVWAAMWTLIISKWGKGLNLEAWYALMDLPGVMTLCGEEATLHCIVEE